MGTLKIAIVEDDKNYHDVIRDFLTAYCSKNGIDFSITDYYDGVSFLHDSLLELDLIFLDIEMPLMNGIEIGKKIRELQIDTPIVIISHSAAYALKGYEIEAKGYIVKPISQYNFEFVMDKVIDELKKNNKDEYLSIKTRKEIIRIKLDDLLFIEVNEHDLSFHIKGDKNITIRGKIGEYEKLLEGKSFFRINNCYLVNLKYCLDIDVSKSIVTIEGKSLSIARGRKKAFLERFNEFMGELL